jgi:hypothetical protein
MIPRPPGMAIVGHGPRPRTLGLKMPLPYLIIAVCYLLACAALGLVVRGRARWLVLVGEAAVGAVVLLPLSCVAAPILLCPAGATDCTPSGLSCTSLAGLRGPLTDAPSDWTAMAVGAAIVLLGMAITWGTNRFGDKGGLRDRLIGRRRPRYSGT